MKRMIIALLALTLAVSALAGCGEEKTSSTSKTSDTATQAATEQQAEKGDITMVLSGSITDLSKVPAPDHSKINESYQSAAPEKGDVVAILHTSMGDIKFRFFPEAAPMAVNNFIALAKAGKYDNTIFHRIFHLETAGISGIQGGDYTKFNGTGGESIYGSGFGYETSPYLSNTRGSVAMAHSSLPDSNGSQFYINQGDNSVLDGGYTIFGQVVEGLDVLDAIYGVETDANDRPLNDVSLTGVEITTY